MDMAARAYRGQSLDRSGSGATALAWIAKPIANGRNGMSTDGNAPDTIVLIHGFWVTPRSWEHWITHFESQGYTVLAPAYPGFEVEVESLNADPAPIEAVTVPQIIEHLESVVGAVAKPPILMGHSAGGVFTQVLLDHGFGAAGVAINSAPTEGVKRVPLSQIKATFPVLKNPANRHRAVGFTLDQWQYAFTNTFSDEESKELYERYHIPASGQIFWGSALANIHPGHDDNYVNYRNDERAPLLFISGTSDHLMPPSIQRSNAKHYTSTTITEVREYAGPHLLPSQEGWEEIADAALEWALENARTWASRAVTSSA
jgi:pimeloyl-ACP methyl ester carboxylesterase